MKIDQDAKTEPYISGAVRWLSFEKTDTGFMAKACFRPKGANMPHERYLHSPTLEDLAKKISDAIIANGVE